MKASSALFLLIMVTSTALVLEGIVAEVFGSVRQVLGFTAQFMEGPLKPTALQKYLSSVKDSCTNLQQGTFDPVTWTISTDTFCPNHFQTGPYVANGYFGQALPSEAVGYWTEKHPDGSWATNGWPLDQPRATFGTIAGFWNLQEKVKHPSLPENVKRGGESVISGIPDWTGLVVTNEYGESYLPGVDPAVVIKYSQSLSVRNGIVHTNITWKPTEHTVFQLNYTVLAHRTRINLGLVRLDVTVTGPTRLIITDVLDGAGATRAHFGDKEVTDQWMWTSVKPWGIETTTAYVGSVVGFSGLSEKEIRDVKKSQREAMDNKWVSQNLSSIAQSWDFEFGDLGCRTFSVYKYVGIASSDAFPKKTQSTAFHAAVEAADTPWDILLQEHTEAWDASWSEADIVVPDNEELQILARGSLFHLLANTLPGSEKNGLGDNSIMVSGLSSDSYAGLIFWDSDVWMYPPLLLLQPEYAKSINNYRSRLLPQAIENAQSYNYSGLLFPWTSGRFGNCTGTGLCKDYQYHLNHDIAQSHWNYYLHTHDDMWLREKGWPIIKNTADMFANYVIQNISNGLYETKLLGEPDEFAYNINNGAYTNAGIKMLLSVWAQETAEVLGITPAKNWTAIAARIKIPYDEQENMIIEYDGMDGSVRIKQASVTLINYPIGWNINERQAQNDMAFYAAASIADGPAMTWSMFAINAANLDDQGCAVYTYLLQGSQPYLRAPFYQFSEQQTDSWHTEHFGKETNAAFPFLTAYGGFLQVFTHGFSGIRPQLDALFMDPMMVPQLPSGLTLKGVKYQGAVLDISIGPEVTTIVCQKLAFSSSPILIRIGGKAHKPGDYPLYAGETLTIPTRRPDHNGTAVSGNLAQCAPAFSSQPYMPGRLPLAAVDGSNATLWQPAFPYLSVLVIDLGHLRTVSGINVNWGQTPAQEMEVRASEAMHGRYDRVLKIVKVRISEPYNPEEAGLVKIREGNVTTAQFERKLDARFIRVEIQGTWGNDKSVGATVAEVAIL